MSRWTKRLLEETRRLAAYARALGRWSSTDPEKAVSRPFLFRQTLAQMGRTRRLHAACERLGIGGTAAQRAARSIEVAESVCRRVWATEEMQGEWNEQLRDLDRQLDVEDVGTDSWATWTYLGGLEDAADEFTEFERIGAGASGLLVRVLLMEETDQPFKRRLSSLPGRARRELEEGLQNYRLANLTIRALGDRRDQWVQVHDMIQATDSSAIINAILAALGDPEDRDLRRFVTSVLETISDVGLDGLQEVTSADTRSAGAAPLGGHQVNLIPSSGAKSVCAPFVLAMISGVKGQRGFASVLRDLTEHLISCLGKSNRVLVVTDAWDGASFRRDHLANWRAFNGRGVRFAVLQYTGTSSQPTVLQVDLS